MGVSGYELPLVLSLLRSPISPSCSGSEAVLLKAKAGMCLGDRIPLRTADFKGWQFPIFGSTAHLGQLKNDSPALGGRCSCHTWLWEKCCPQCHSSILGLRHPLWSLLCMGHPSALGRVCVPLCEPLSITGNSRVTPSPSCSGRRHICQKKLFSSTAIPPAAPMSHTPQGFSRQSKVCDPSSGLSSVAMAQHSAVSPWLRTQQCDHGSGLSRVTVAQDYSVAAWGDNSLSASGQCGRNSGHGDASSEVNKYLDMPP